MEGCGGNDEAGHIAAKLVFVRNRSNRKDSLVLFSTDTTLTEDLVVQIYRKRWNTEAFIKSCKSLTLG